MANYPTEATLYLVHGARNIQKWADLDSNVNSVNIADRVEWACELATEYVNGRLILNRYSLPFVAVPRMVIHIASLLGGILLHDGKVVTDQVRDMVAPKRKEFNRLLRQILAGQMKLVDPVTGDALEACCYTAPQVITADTNLFTQYCGNRVTNTGFCNVQTAWCSTCCCHTCICRSLHWPCW